MAAITKKLVKKSAEDVLTELQAICAYVSAFEWTQDGEPQVTISDDVQCTPKVQNQVGYYFMNQDCMEWEEVVA